MPLHRAIAALRVRLLSLSRAGFARSVGVLVGGTAFAQALGILILPLVTRLYSPADFSALAAFISISSIISIVACLRLEIAIPMPEENDEAVNLLAASLCICTIVAAIVGLIVWQYSSQILNALGQPSLGSCLWLLPVTIWAASAYSAIQFWSTRQKKFAVIAKTRISQAIGGAGAQVGFGLFGLAPLGLVLGQTISSGAGLLSLMRAAIREDCAIFRKISVSRMWKALQHYQRFPKYATFEAFANTAGAQLPIIIIASNAVGPEAGYLALAVRAMAAPMGLVGGAISQVYLSKAPEELRAGNLGEFSAGVLRNLFRVGVGPLIFIGIVAPPFFALIFGSRWERSGEIVSWMIPWFVFQFMSSPISMVMHVVGKQRLMLAITVFGLLLRLGFVALASFYAVNLISEAYAISGGVFYLVCCWMFARAAGVTDIAARKIFRESSWVVACWITAAILLRAGFYFS